MSLTVFGNYSASAAATLAATKSFALASAPGPERLGLHEEDHGRKEERKIWTFAADLFKSGMDSASIEVKLRETYTWMTEIDAVRAQVSGYQILQIENGGRAEGRDPPTFVGTTFTGPQEAKAFALEKLRELNRGLALYNEGVLAWSSAEAREMRAAAWKRNYDVAMFQTGDETKAIEWADQGLKDVMAHEGRMNDSLIRSALGALETAFGLSGWSLIRENEDGTLSLNRTALSFGGQTVLDIGSPVGQNVDQAA